MSRKECHALLTLGGALLKVSERYHNNSSSNPNCLVKILHKVSKLIKNYLNFFIDFVFIIYLSIKKQ